MGRRASLIVALLAVMPGCGGAGGASTPGTPRPTIVRGDAGLPRLLDHHLGLVPAGEKRRHTFRLANATGRDWTVRDVRSTCSCTVAEVSSERLARGESLAVRVDYAAPAKTAEDSRAVYLTLEDEAGSAREVVLRIQASVREPITVLPVSVRVDASSEAAAPTLLQAENWSGRDWRSLDVRSTVDWISVDVRPVQLPGHKSDRTPRQAWRVELSALPPARRLKDGNAREAQLTLSSVGAEPSVATTVPLQLLGGEKVRAVPSILVFKGEAGGEESTARTVLTFSGDVTTFEARDVKIDHGPMPGLSFAWTAKSPREWELVARMATSAAAAGSPTKGSVVLTFPDDRLPPLRLPVFRPVPRDEASSAIQ